MFVSHQPPKQVMFAAQKKSAVGTCRRARPSALGIGPKKSGDCQLDAAGSEGNWKICRQHLASGRQPVPAHATNMKMEKAMGNQVEPSPAGPSALGIGPQRAKAATLLVAAPSRTSRQAERPSSPFTVRSSQRVRGPPAQRRAPKAVSSPPGAASWPPPGRPP